MLNGNQHMSMIWVYLPTTISIHCCLCVFQMLKSQAHDMIKEWIGITVIINLFFLAHMIHTTESSSQHEESS